MPRKLWLRMLEAEDQEWDQGVVKGEVLGDKDSLLMKKVPRRGKEISNAIWF
jgi:hypothetical protein